MRTTEYRDRWAELGGGVSHLTPSHMQGRGVFLGVEESGSEGAISLRVQSTQSAEHCPFKEEATLDR